jgi:hypothetical protein
MKHDFAEALMLLVAPVNEQQFMGAEAAGEEGERVLAYEFHDEKAV